MKRAGFILLVIIMCVNLCGCWDYREFNEMGLTVVLGIDYDPSTETTTAIIQQMVTNSSSKGDETSGSSETKVTEGTGENFLAAVGEIERRVSERIFWGYCADVVIGEDAAREILADVILCFEHSPDLPMTSNIYVCDGKAAEFLKGKRIVQNTINENSLSARAQKAEVSGITVNKRVSEFVAALSREGSEAIAVKASKEQSGTEEEKSQAGSESKSQEKSEEDLVRIDGIAVFKGLKYIGDLSRDDSRGFRYLSGENMQEYVTLAIQDVGEIWYQIKSSTAKTNITVGEDDNLEIDIKVDVEAKVYKYLESQKISIMGEKEIKTCSDALNRKIKALCENTLATIQKEYGSDILNIGFQVFRKNPRLWNQKFKENWNEIFSGLNIKVEVSSKIVNTGDSIGNNILQREREN